MRDLYNINYIERFSVYRIHYIGWSKNWDTWAKHSQILKSTTANLQLKDELMAKVCIQYFITYQYRSGDKLVREILLCF